MWFVDQGAVSIYMTLGDAAHGTVEDKRLRTYGPGTIIGEMGFYTEATRSASIVADEKTTLRRLTRDKLLELEEKRPELAHKLHRYVISLLSARVKAANEEIRTLL